MRAPESVLDRLPASSRQLLRERPPPRWVDPTLATLTHETFSDPDWLFEPKLDGERCLLFKHDGRVRLISRNRKQLNRTYPEVVTAFAEQAADDVILDGEIVAFEGNRTSFARLQQRMQLSDPTQARRSGVEVVCYLFDLLRVTGHDATALPLRDRKALLRRAVQFSDPLRWTPYRDEHGKSYHQQACRAGWEGVLAKDARSAYARGRSRRWLKFKCVASQEFVIGGFTEPTGSRNGLGALLVGYYAGPHLVYAGKVGAGFTDKALGDLRRRLGSEERSQPPFDGAEAGERGVHWVAPSLVADIAFTEWTDDGKLRHPRFQGLRRDKDPADVTAERPAQTPPR